MYTNIPLITEFNLLFIITNSITREVFEEVTDPPYSLTPRGQPLFRAGYISLQTVFYVYTKLICTWRFSPSYHKKLNHFRCLGNLFFPLTISHRLLSSQVSAFKNHNKLYFLVALAYILGVKTFHNVLIHSHTDTQVCYHSFNYEETKQSFEKLIYRGYHFGFRIIFLKAGLLSQKVYTYITGLIDIPEMSSSCYHLIVLSKMYEYLHTLTPFYGLGGIFSFCSSER